MNTLLSVPVSPRAVVSPMPIDPEIVADCPYGPEGMLLDAILEVDPAQSLVRARMPTCDELPLTREQRAHPVRHPRHVSAGLMVHMGGMVAFVHAYHLLGIRHRDGWIGYGAKIHEARFCALAVPGEPLILECRATRIRRRGASIVARYTLRFTQKGTLVYEADVTGIWLDTAAEARPGPRDRVAPARPDASSFVEHDSAA
jgi:hypothetical protein